MKKPNQKTNILKKPQKLSRRSLDSSEDGLRKVTHTTASRLSIISPAPGLHSHKSNSKPTSEYSRNSHAAQRIRVRMRRTLMTYSFSTSYSIRAQARVTLQSSYKTQLSETSGGATRKQHKDSHFSKANS